MVKGRAVPGETDLCKQTSAHDCWNRPDVALNRVKLDFGLRTNLKVVVNEQGASSGALWATHLDVERTRAFSTIGPNLCAPEKLSYLNASGHQQ